jgi:cell division protein FtsB
MPGLQIPPMARLLLEIAALRRQVKALQAEVTDLKDRLAKLDPPDAA